MDDHTKDFLLAEFQTSWQQVMNIDNRRGTFFNFYHVAFFGALTFTASLWSKLDTPSLATAIALSIVDLLLIFMGKAVKEILESERSANIRYRNKINLIREIFLSGTKSNKIRYYLSQKHLGIKTYTDDKESLDSIGGTLKGIFKWINIERTALIIAFVLVWVVYFAGFFLQ